MPDRDKVIKGLEQCISVDETCTGCPYEGTVCTTTLNSDALALIKEQEAEISFLKGMQLKTIHTQNMSDEDIGDAVAKLLQLKGR